MAQFTVDIKDRPNVPFEALFAEAAEAYGVPISDIQVLLVEDGYGTHIHDEACRYGQGPVSRGYPCFRHLDNSDWIVTLQYNEAGHQSIFGVYKGEFGCWMD